MPLLTAAERVGTRLADKYRLDHILGRGGFGTVYAGVHTWTDREIAVKVLNPEFVERHEVVQRFLQEAKAAARLKHRHVVDVLDMGREGDGTVYLVLERLHGQELADLLEQRGRLPLPTALAILLPVMHALARAHEAGITHRDLKPQNIFLHTDSEGQLVPKVLDFGIAKMATGANQATRTGVLMGTPEFMAPEQAHGASNVGPPADVWSMGIVLWNALTGTLPFDGPTPTAVLTQIVTQAAPPFAEVAPELQGPVAAVIDRALAQQTDARYPHMRAFLEDLRGAAAAVGVALPGDPSAEVRLPESSGAHPIDAGLPPATPVPLTGARTPPPTSTSALSLEPPSGTTPVSPTGPTSVGPSSGGWAPPPGATPNTLERELASGHSWLVPLLLVGVVVASIGAGTFAYLAFSFSTRSTTSAATAESPANLDDAREGDEVEAGAEPELPVALDPPPADDDGGDTAEADLPSPEPTVEPVTAVEARPRRPRRRRPPVVIEEPPATSTAPREPVQATTPPAELPTRTTNDVPVIR